MFRSDSSKGKKRKIEILRDDENKAEEPVALSDDETTDNNIKSHNSESDESTEAHNAKTANIVEDATDDPSLSQDAVCEENQIDQLESEIDKLKDALLRERAAFNNYRKRSEEEKALIRQYGSQDLAFDLLIVLDYFEESMKFNASDMESQAIMQGVKYTIEELHRILAKHGIKEIDTCGKFDPKYHEAFGTDAVSGEESGKILQVHRKGYLYKDRVLRSAMVTVAVEPDQMSEDEPDSDKFERNPNSPESVS